MNLFKGYPAYIQEWVKKNTYSKHNIRKSENIKRKRKKKKNQPSKVLPIAVAED